MHGKRIQNKLIFFWMSHLSHPGLLFNRRESSLTLIVPGDSLQCSLLLKSEVPSHLSTMPLSLFNSIKMKKCELKSCKKIHNLSSHFKVIKFCFEIFNSDQS